MLFSARVAAGLAAHAAARGEMAGKIVAMRDYWACFDVHDIGQVLMAWTAHARALVDNVAPLPQGAAEGVLKHTERARLRALLALLGNVAAGGGRLPPGPTTLVVFGVERMSERILQRRLSFVFALDRSRTRPTRRAIVGAFREKARLCPHFSSISATGALLAALDCAATARTDDIIEERRGVPTRRAPNRTAGQG